MNHPMNQQLRYRPSILERYSHRRSPGDPDLNGFRLLDTDPDLDDLTTRYVEFHRKRGNGRALAP